MNWVIATTIKKIVIVYDINIQYLNEVFIMSQSKEYVDLLRIIM